MQVFHIEQMSKMAGNMVDHGVDQNTAKWATMQVFAFIDCYNKANAESILTGKTEALNLANFSQKVFGL